MHLTKPVLTGAAVRLRPLVADDAAAMYASLDDPESMRLTGTQSAFTFEQVKRHCEHVEHADDRLDYAIEVASQPVGEVVLNCVDDINRSASFRIAIWYNDHRNRGIGTEATRLLVRHGFDVVGLNRIELEVYSFNPRARRVYENAGFRLEGTRRQALLWDGEFVDAHTMAMLREDFPVV
ncbi:GNAT family N-acetyltransferase [Anderseniella sp. Alg231-50]|uniref:GNAT family N-acetyltransferase n=1 Tax=Anderseniella sp. Alg231-50 TaxID=1922226 RepID=UPI00307C21E9